MPLMDIELVTAPDPAGTGRAEALLREAERRVAAFLEATRDEPRRDFVTSDYRAVYAALRAVRERGLTTGNVFCEWGSGFGVVTALAASLGFESYGIENRPELVRAARQLAADFDVKAEFIEADYIPNGYDYYTDAVAGSKQLVHSAHDGHARRWEEQAGLCMEDVHLVFVYPWPGEMEFIEELFDACAGEGALLLRYEENRELHLQRRVDAEDVPGEEAWDEDEEKAADTVA